ncbi:Programmed cell death protein 2, C-terminal putative domain containing protein [Rhypophila sp. PSN 637]
MVNYDSDSSGGEDNDYTETNVLLGYVSSDANGEEISRLGGRPDWLDPSHPPSAALARCKVCKDLMVLLLQLNAELPDRFPGHERRLYVFSCRRKSCRLKEGSIRALRGVRVSENAATTTAEKKEKATPAPVAPSAASLGLGEALFGVKTAASTAGSAIQAVNPFATGGAAAAVNPFASKSSTTSTANPFSPKTSEPAQTPAPAQQEETEQKEQEAETKKLPETFAQKLSLNNDQAVTITQGPAAPPEPWPPANSENDTRPYPVKWLSDAEYETLDPTPALPAQATQIMDLDTDAPGGSGSGGKEDKEVFESTMDSVFQKFADRVGQNPEQCIRYEFNGVPLLYSKNDTVGKLLYTGGEGNEKVKTTGAKGIPRCTNCGAGRVFEVQMTPHAITELEEGDGEENDMVLDGMDWGTVILGVCEKDCLERGSKKGEAGYVEEWVGVQWEELSVKR